MTRPRSETWWYQLLPRIVSDSRGSFRRLRTRGLLATMLSSTLPSSHSYQLAVVAGEPSGRTVATTAGRGGPHEALELGRERRLRHRTKVCKPEQRRPEAAPTARASLGASDQGAGDYTIHNPLQKGTDVYISWYSDGIRVVDASDPTRPREVAFFVPPSANNPVSPSQRGTLTNATQVWGVAVDDSTGLVYASDMNSGLCPRTRGPRGVIRSARLDLGARRLAQPAAGCRCSV
jgi:hypothetical protein